MQSRRSNRRQFVKRGALFVPALFSILPARADNLLSGPIMQTKGAAGGGGGSFTFVQKTHTVNDAGGLSASVSLTGVTAGNLIILGLKSEGGNLVINSVSDGSSTFGIGTNTNHTNNDLRWQFAYCLSSVASGSVTYTLNLSNGSGVFFWTFAMEFSGSGTRGFDTENGASGTSTAVDSGNITTGAANCLAVGSYAHYSGSTLSSLLIGGSAAGGSEPTTPAASNSVMWYRILTGVMTGGAASGTLDGSADWVSRIISIKAT